MKNERSLSSMEQKKDIKNSLHPEHYDDLKKSGLSDDTIISAGIETVPPDKINEEIGYNHPGISSIYKIPYPGTDFSRYKVFYSEDFKGKKSKYLQRKNSNNHLYIPENVRTILQDTQIPLYFSEGEKKALKAYQEGLYCIGLSGLWNWSGGNKKLIQDFDLIHFEGREVYIVPDNDFEQADKHGYEKNLKKAVNELALKLKERGAKVFVIRLPEGEAKGLDDYLCENSVDDFKKLPVYEVKMEESKDMKAFIDAHTDYLSIIKALCDIPWDGQRDEWITYLNEKRGFDKRSIRKDIKQFFKQSIIETNEETQEVFTEQEKEKASELLKSPNLLERFLQASLKLGIVSEKVNKLCVYLAYTSRLLEEPISVMVLGQSSSGKSHIANGVLQFFPKSAYLSYSSITPQSLYYLKDKELKHRILIIFEKAGSERADYSIRTFISEKELKILYVTKDPRTGDMISKELVKEGPIAFCETSSNPKTHTDNLTRVFALYAEEHPKKIKGVLLETARTSSQGKPKGIEDELRVWQCLQTLLIPYMVKIRFAELLVDYFPTDTVRVQRDFKRFLALIEASCLLHQYQREKDGDYLIATIKDYQVAYETGQVILAQTLKEISPKGEEFLEAIKKLKEEKGEDNFSFTRKDIEEYVDRDTRQVNRCLKELTTREYIGILSGGKGKPYTYSIDGDVRIRITLPTPKELENIMLMGLSNCPTHEVISDNKGLEPGQGGLSNLVQPVQPTFDLDNLDKPGQKPFVQPKTALDKDLREGWTPGQKGKQPIINVEEFLG